ncbi:MAG: hypothetical protein N2C14_26810, partial [Planctomycetales bacterium]
MTDTTDATSTTGEPDAFEDYAPLPRAPIDRVGKPKWWMWLVPYERFVIESSRSWEEIRRLFGDDGKKTPEELGKWRPISATGAYRGRLEGNEFQLTRSSLGFVALVQTGVVAETDGGIRVEMKFHPPTWIMTAFACGL